MNGEHLRSRARWLMCLLCVPLGIMTLWLIGQLIDLLAPAWADAAEYLLIPGAILGMIVSPGGVHGSSPERWAYAVILGNYAFYIAFWCLIAMLCLKPWRASRHERDSS